MSEIEHAVDRMLEQEPGGSNPETVRKNHTFFWDTTLSVEEMSAIDDFIGQLSPEDRKLLDLLLRDTREDEERSAAGEHE